MPLAALVAHLLRLLLHVLSLPSFSLLLLFLFLYSCFYLLRLIFLYFLFRSWKILFLTPFLSSLPVAGSGVRTMPLTDHWSLCWKAVSVIFNCIAVLTFCLFGAGLLTNRMFVRIDWIKLSKKTWEQHCLICFNLSPRKLKQHGSFCPTHVCFKQSGWLAYSQLESNSIVCMEGNLPNHLSRRSG